MSNYNTDGKKAEPDSQDYRHAVSQARTGYSAFSQYEAIAAALLAMARCEHKNMRQGDAYFEPVETAIGQYTKHSRLWCHDCGFDSAFAWKYEYPWLLNEHSTKELVRRGKTQLEQMQEFKARIKAYEDKFDAKRLKEEEEGKGTTNT